MKKHIFVMLVLAVFPVAGFALAEVNGQLVPVPGTIFSAEDVEKGAHCNVKDVVLLAKSDADCTKAGGKVVQVKDAAGKK